MYLTDFIPEPPQPTMITGYSIIPPILGQAHRPLADYLTSAIQSDSYSEIHDQPYSSSIDNRDPVEPPGAPSSLGITGESEGTDKIDLFS
jgi:hypothetical protein